MDEKRTSSKGGLRSLALIVATVSILWLGIFPWLARTETVRARSEWLKRHGINLAAFNYSDHENATIPTHLETGE